MSVFEEKNKEVASLIMYMIEERFIFQCVQEFRMVELIAIPPSIFIKEILLIFIEKLTKVHTDPISWFANLTAYEEYV